MFVPKRRSSDISAVSRGASGPPVWPVAASAIAVLGVAVPGLAALDVSGDTASTSRSLGLAGLGFGLAWLALTWLWRGLATSSHRPGLGAAVMILGVAATARGIVAVAAEPVLSDDVYRYVFDGRNGANGINPYLPVPGERITAADASWSGEARLAERVNNPELTTIYLPTSQWFFTAVAWCVPESVTDPDDLARIFRGAFCVLDLVLIGLMLVALRAQHRSLWWACLYAWHPLPIAEIAGSGHQDGLGIVLLFLVLILGDQRSARGWIGWTPLLAASALVKPLVLPVAAFLLRGRSARVWIGSLVLGAVVTTVIAGPWFLSEGGAPVGALRQTAATFSAKWAHFGSVYEPLLALHGVIEPIEDEAAEWMTVHRHEQTIRWVCFGLFAVVALVTWMRVKSAWAATRVLMLALVLFSTTAHPWYLLWALALMPVVGSPTLWVASLTLPLGYVALLDPVEWTTPVWAFLAAYIPVYSVLIVDLVRTRGRDTDRGDERAATGSEDADERRNTG